MRVLLASLCLVILAGVNSAPAADARVHVFAIGFTGITDDGATLVFTTSAAAKATVTVRAGTELVQSIEEPASSQIHRVALTGLKPNTPYEVAIRGQAADGTAFTADTTLRVGLRPHPVEPFDHRTYLGVTHADDVELLGDLGVGMVRVETSWDKVQPRQDGFDEARLAKYADFVSQLHDKGIEPLVLLGYGNPWAKTFTDKLMTWRLPAFGPPDRIEDWQAYVEKIMRTLKGTARFYETWNEPDAGYLASGAAVEAAATTKDTVVHADIFRNNNQYWLGDRYVPLAMAVRQTADAVDPSIHVLGPSWNHDYHATRGEICFSRGLDRYIQSYSFHNYVSAPHSFEAWETATDRLYMTTASRLMEKYQVNMPIAVTEWGTQSFDNPKPQDGFASRLDAQKFLVKSVFYYLNLDRVSMLMLHQMGYNDPWSLLHKDAAGVVVKQPAYFTYRWLCHSFNRKLYRPLSVETDSPDDAKTMRAFAISLPEEPAVYVALWQNRGSDGKQFRSAAAKDLTVRIDGLQAGTWVTAQLDLQGQPISTGTLNVTTTASWKLTVQEASGAEESTPLIWRLTPSAVEPKK